MGKNNALIPMILIIAVIAGVFLVYSALIKANVVPQGGDSGAKYQCDFKIQENFWLTSASIQELNCYKKSDNCGLLFSIFSLKGHFTVTDSTGMLLTKNYETGGLFEAHTSASTVFCTPDNTVNIKLYNDDNVLYESKQVVLS